MSPGKCIQSFSVVLILLLACQSKSDAIISKVIAKLKNPDQTLCSVDFYDFNKLECDVPIHNGNLGHNGTCRNSEGDDFQYIHCVNGHLYISAYSHSGYREKRADKEEKMWGAVGIGAVFGGVGGALTLGVACWIFCEDDPPEPNKPPSITCFQPEQTDIIAIPLQEYAVVNWKNPVTSDPENDAVSISGGKPASGSKFSHGVHYVIYYATDTHGNMAICDVHFKVTVNYCRQSLYVRNGRVLCNPWDQINGAVCEVKCDEGYELAPDSVPSVKCEGTQFSEGTIECRKKRCQIPEPICNGNFTCTSELYEYESICYPTCMDSYETDITRNMKCDGENWSGKNIILDCKDAEPPEFISCPDSITRYADRGKDIATNVTWEIPLAIDNSESAQNCSSPSSLTVEQVAGLSYGSDFQEGFHIVKYKATDGTGLYSTCSFYVIVEVIACDPLVPADNFLISRCPTGYSYGSSCQFSCFMSYILQGNDSVTCEIDESGKHGKWAWQNNTESFCEKLMCPELPAPANGALACSTVLGNQICVMACNERFQTPLKPPSEFVCNDEQVWIQGIPPNCTQRRNPNIAVMPGELIYFYSGDCNDETVQEGIKQHFVTVMEDMAYNRNWSNICPSFCNVSDVSVTCGPVTGRRKRDVLAVGFVKRSTNQITLSFNLEMGWLSGGDYWFNDEKVVAISEEITAMNSNGRFDYGGISPVIAFSYSSIGCKDGSIPDYYAETCRGCAPGTYLSNEECLKCSKGFYEENEYSSSCSACPTGMSTAETGSINLSDCIEMCPPGSYSKTGVFPCTPCPIGEYQSSAGQTACLTCKKGQFTRSTGSNSVNKCEAFDVMMSETSSVWLVPTTTTIDNFVLGCWLMCTAKCDSVLTLIAGKFEFQIGNILTVSNSNETASNNGNIFKAKSWIQLVITWSQSNEALDIYYNGLRVMTKIFPTLTDSRLPIGSQLKIESVGHSFVLSGFYLRHAITSDTFVKTCTPELANTIYTMSDILLASNMDAEISASRCDDIDECLSSPCGVKNICHNQIGGYNCTCLGGYSGNTCEIPPDFCIDHRCINGATCQSLFNNYTCHCASGFKGPLCQTAVVNGGWGNWQEWSECSASCEGGNKTRKRNCDNPPPDTDGFYCTGSSSETTDCNKNDCPSCPPYYTIYRYKNYFNCSETDSYVSCSVTCQDGYIFAKDFVPLDKYECGPNTSYKWNAIPPPCTDIRSPRQLTTQSSITYQNVACDMKDDLQSAVTLKVNSLQCITNATCESSVTTKGCNFFSRKRRSTSDLEVIVTLFSTLNENGNLDFSSFYSSNIVSPDLADLVNSYVDLSYSTYEIVNNTDFTTVDVNGVVYTADLTSINTTSSVECSPGRVEYEAICVECPRGTYWKDGLCVLCPIGTYQLNQGQQECLACPSGYTTLYVASNKETDCSVTLDTTSTSSIVTTSTTKTPVTTSETMINTESTTTTTSTTVSQSSTDDAPITTSRNQFKDGDSQKYTNRNSDKLRMIVPLSVTVVLACVIVVTAIAYLKYRQHMRLKARKNLTSSFASLNMVHPSVLDNKVESGIAPKVETHVYR